MFTAQLLKHPLVGLSNYQSDEDRKFTDSTFLKKLFRAFFIVNTIQIVTSKCSLHILLKHSPTMKKSINICVPRHTQLNY